MKTLLLAWLLLIAGSTRSMAACDPTMISGTPYYTDADSAVVQDPFRSFAHSTEGFDYHAGRLFGHCSACFEVANVEGSDAYVIEGAPAGVAVPIHVEFRIEMNQGGSYTACLDFGCGQKHTSGFASLYSGGAGDSLGLCFCGGATKSIGLDLAPMTDEEFVIRYHLEEWTGTDGFAAPGQIEGRIYFSGIPSGAQLVSCHGVDDGAVAALPSTWGGLKARYR